VKTSLDFRPHDRVRHMDGREGAVVAVDAAERPPALVVRYEATGQPERLPAGYFERLPEAFALGRQDGRRPL
jgi:hypothetical protein